MAAHCSSNLSLSLPLTSKRNAHTPSTQFRFFNPNAKNRSCFGIRAQAQDMTRGNLDHLQRVTRQPNQQKPTTSTRRTAPTPPVGLWDRFPTAKTVQQMMDTMDRIMEEPFAYSNGIMWPSSEGPRGYGRGRTPWEIKEGETEYKMRFDMPGMTKEDVKVWVEEKMLVLKAEKVPKKTSNGHAVEEEEEEGGAEWSAKSYGKYSCRIALPENVEFGKIRAEVKDGVLYITIPKASVTSKVLDIAVE